MSIDPDVYVSVVAPVHNDGDIVDSFIEETLAVLRAHFVHFELLLVDDGSADDTVERIDRWLASSPGLRLIRLSRTFGGEIAISAGLESVIGDYVVVMLPADDPPALLPAMIERARGGAGIVFGIRRHRRGEPWPLRAGAALFYWLCNRVLRLNLPPNSTHFRVLSRQAVNAIVQVRDNNRYLRTLSAFVGYRNQSFEYDLLERRSPPRRKGLFEAAQLALNIIVSNSVAPLLLAGWLGLLVSTAAFAYFAYTVLVYLFKSDVAAGWTTESLVLATMLGTTSLLLTLVCVYLARVLNEARDRPMYYVQDERASASLPGLVERRNVVHETTHA